MKPILRVMSYFIVLLSMSSHLTGKELTSIVIATGEYPPFLSQDENADNIGLNVIRDAFTEVGVSVTFVFFPWKRTYLMTKNGEFDATATWSYQESREPDFFHSDPLYQSKGVLFHRKNLSFDWQKIEDLSPYIIGTTRNYSYTPAFWKAQETGILTVEMVESDQQNFRRLLAGRIQLFPVNIDVGLFLLKSQFSEKEAASLTYHPQPFSNDNVHVLFSKKKPTGKAFQQLFNKGLRSINSKGLIEKYFASYRGGLINDHHVKHKIEAPH